MLEEYLASRDKFSRGVEAIFARKGVKMEESKEVLVGAGKDWSGLTEGEKIQRLREQVWVLIRDNARLTKMVTNLRFHTHNTAGDAVVDIPSFHGMDDSFVGPGDGGVGPFRDDVHF